MEYPCLLSDKLYDNDRDMAPNN